MSTDSGPDAHAVNINAMNNSSDFLIFGLVIIWLMLSRLADGTVLSRRRATMATASRAERSDVAGSNSS